MKKIIRFLLVFIITLIFPLFVNAKEKTTLYIFHGNGCPHCAEEIKFLDSIESKYKDLEIVKYEVWYNEENADLLKKVEEAFDIERPGVPTTVIGDVMIQGYGSNTGEKIERVIKFYKENDYTDQIQRIKDGTFNKDDLKDDFDKQEKETDESMTIKVPLLGKTNLKKVSLISSAVIIGLIDGFNPCAMWILLFLISVLIGMKNRK